MRRPPGFSLVEVTMALGIMSFSIVGLMGLLPVGLSHFREAMEIQAQAQVEQQIVAEFQLMRFSDMQAGDYLDTFPRYYDQRGGALTPGESSVLYTVTASAPANVNLPGTAGSTNTMVVRFDLVKKTAPLEAKVFSLVAANNGH